LLEIRKAFVASIVKLEVASRKLFGKPVQTAESQLQELKRNRKGCKSYFETSKEQKNASKTTFACPCGISSTTMSFRADCRCWSFSV
jgi:mannitol-specific phosphotransferase system IIBC component